MADLAKQFVRHREGSNPREIHYSVVWSVLAHIILDCSESRQKYFICYSRSECHQKHTGSAVRSQNKVHPPPQELLLSRSPSSLALTYARLRLQRSDALGKLTFNA